MKPQFLECRCGLVHESSEQCTDQIFFQLVFQSGAPAVLPKNPSIRRILRQDAHNDKQAASPVLNELANGLEKVLLQYQFYDLATMLGIFFLAYRFGRVSKVSCDGFPTRIEAFRHRMRRHQKLIAMTYSGICTRLLMSTPTFPVVCGLRTPKNFTHIRSSLILSPGLGCERPSVRRLARIDDILYRHISHPSDSSGQKIRSS